MQSYIVEVDAGVSIFLDAENVEDAEKQVGQMIEAGDVDVRHMSVTMGAYVNVQGRRQSCDK
tara:strand:- start:311 stop:496 length:186 start_codon:yes stop_codon:yes gene_type:complete